MNAGFRFNRFGAVNRRYDAGQRCDHRDDRWVPNFSGNFHQRSPERMHTRQRNTACIHHCTPTSPSLVLFMPSQKKKKNNGVYCNKSSPPTTLLVTHTTCTLMYTKQLNTHQYTREKKKTKKFVSARISFFLSHKHREEGKKKKIPQSSQGGSSAKSAWATRKRPAQRSGPSGVWWGNRRGRPSYEVPDKEEQ